jgi:polyisoprenoid-binding protein YceI
LNAAAKELPQSCPQLEAKWCEHLEAGMRFALKMADHEILHAISSSDDSAIVAEVHETRLMRKYKYFLAFENFRGELHYVPNHPEKSRLTLDLDARSVSCRDRSLRESKQRRVAEYVREQILNAGTYPAIQFSSYQISAKALRGFAVEGVLTVRGTTRAFKMNAVISPASADRLEIEADSLFRFSEFGAKAPSSLFGMVETSDQVLIHLRLYAARVGADNTAPQTGLSPRL